MAILILLGWMLGLGLGAAAITLALMSFGVTLPAVVAPLGPLLAPLFTSLSPLTAFLLSVVVLVVSYAIGYTFATAGIAPALPGLTGRATPVPAPVSVPTPGGAAVAVPASAGEFFGRGLMIGITAMSNSILLVLIPYAGLVLGSWAFTVVSLSAIVFVARNRIFQGFLAWSSWLFPMSHIATVVGLLLFIVNIPFAILSFGIGAFAFDWTTGVVATAGGLAAAAGAIGFSLGNFIFTGALPVAGAFTAPSVQSHETGHSLHTAAMGGIVLWIDAIDENWVPPRSNLAYGELVAEGHAQNFGAEADFFVRLWV